MPTIVSDSARHGPAVAGGAWLGADDRVRRAQRGDVAAYESLYREHAGRVYALCLRVTGDRAHAAELTQDVFVRAWERLAQFRGESVFSTWLHRLTVNLVLEHARAEERRARRERLEGDAPPLAGPPAPAVAREERMDFERALAALPPAARVVYVLHDVEGYKRREIARLTGGADGALRAQLHKARRRMLERLSR